MADTITIEECITRLDAIRHEIVPDSRDHFALSAGIAALYELESNHPVNRWISCAERLPEVYEKVITYNDKGIIHDNFRLNLRDGSVGWSQGWGITHWQPRPEPPEGGAEDGN